VIRHLDEKHVAGLGEADFIRLVQRRRESGTAISRITLLAAAGDRRERARFQIEAANAMVVDFAKVQRAIRPDGEAVRIIDLPSVTRSAIARKTRSALSRSC